MFAAAALLLATPSCKKGENDPFLSLSSRKARISNEWVVTNISSTYTDLDSDGDSWSQTATFDGTTRTVVSSNTSGGTTVSNTYTYTFSDYSITIEKDGTWSMSQAYTYSEDDDWSWPGYTTTDAHSVTITSSGSWSFVGKEKDAYKGKERVLLNTLNFTWTDNVTSTTKNDGTGNVVDTQTSSNSSTDVEAHGQDVMVYDIDMLKGKEMVWMESYDGNDSNSNTYGSTTTTTSSTYTGSNTMTLEQK